MPEVSTSRVPLIRVRVANDKSVSRDADFVLYWMTAYRRVSWNFSLQRAIGWAQHLGKPLVILEALRCDYSWASDRFHAFVIQGMADIASLLKNKPVLYYPFLETQVGEGKGLLLELAGRAAVVVTDEFPCFF
ncbi:MAG: deoxyribodipyrimidine photolyase, partial [Planctomycetaceae bacterium]|nr:deoxyribodipyrimidine photolyase [Planctomycetaceae bacterium]